jgi:hypothetical protein
VIRPRILASGTKYVDSDSYELTTYNLGLAPQMRLIFHWKIKVSFAKEVRLHMKGELDFTII